MDKKNRTYTLLEDSESDGDAVVEKHKQKSKIKDKATKRKHIRQKKDSSSEDESPKRYCTYLYGLQCCLHSNISFIHLLYPLPPALRVVWVIYSLFELLCGKGRMHQRQVDTSFTDRNHRATFFIFFVRSFDF